MRHDHRNRWDGWKQKRGLLAAGVLAAALLGGCGQRESLENQQPVSEAPRETEKEASGDAEKIVVTYQTYIGSITDDLEEVLAAINEITVPEIGVEVEFCLVDAQEAFSEYPLWLSRGETVDLMMLNYQDITTYISQGMLQSLDGFLEKEGEAILAVREEGYDLTAGSVVEGQTYGVGVVPAMRGSGMGLWTPVSLLEETGWEYEESHVYTAEELADFFSRCKALYPDCYPMAQNISSVNFSFYSSLNRVDSLGADLLTGVLSEEGTLVNLYETEAYYEFLQMMQEWYQAGYLYPDSAFSDASALELAQSGLVLTYVYPSAPSTSVDSIFGEETVCLRTTELSVGYQTSTGAFWTIPASSRHGEAAMRFLNLMYQDSRIGNLIQYGIEGKHYVVLDRETGRIGYPYGVSENSTGYHNPLGLYGDRRKLYTFESAEIIEKQRAYSQEAMENQEVATGFVYSAGQVNLQTAAAQKIERQYVPVLESGSVDLERCYEEFLLQLRLAGIDEILADKQRQYDQWRSSLAER